MSISQVKKKILEALWEAGRPLESREMAKRVGLGIPSATMHLLGLRRARYVSAPEKGYYTITSLGKEVIGLPRIDKERALDILRAVPLEKAFHFYTETDRYTGVYASSLNDFSSKIQTIDIRSVEFHVARGDLESWLHDLGDLELARRVSLIRGRGLSGESLRKVVYDTVKSRCEELANVVREP